MLHTLTLRHLLTSLMGLMVLIALVAIGGDVVDAYARLQKAERIEQANRLGGLALRAINQAGIERGRTTLLLTRAQRTAEELAQLRRLRAQGDELHARLIHQLQELQALESKVWMEDAALNLPQARQHLEEARRLADRLWEGDGNAIGTARWREVTTAYIDELALLRRAALGFHDDEEHPYTDNPLVKQIAHNLLEFAGRERAMIVGVIAQGRPLTQDEMAELFGYRGVIAGNLQRADAVIRQLPPDDKVAAAREAFRVEYQGRFEALRQRVYDAGMHGQAYPVSAEQWFDAATAAIATIMNLSEELGIKAAEDIRQVKAQVRRELLLLTIAATLVVSSMLAMMYVIHRRGLRPLLRLQCAAHTIAAGDLNKPITGFYQDELGDVAAAFESMRNNLRAQMQEQERIEALLQASMQRFRGLVENINDLLWEIDDAGRYTYVSPQVRAMLGCAPEELLGKTPVDLLPPIRAGQLVPVIDALLQRHEPFRGIEIAALHKDGHVVLMEANGVPVFDSSGEFAGYRGISRDITWRKEAEDEKQRLLRVVEQADDLVIITSPQGGIEYVNPAFERITGYSREEVLGKTTGLLKSGLHDAAFYQQMWQTIADGESFHAAIINRRKDGELFHAEETISPLRDPAGNVTHYVCTAKDVTERHRMDEQLRQSDKLASIGQLAAGVAHEINNPIGFIISNLETLKGYLEPLQQYISFTESLYRQRSTAEEQQLLDDMAARLDIAFILQDLPPLIAESSEGADRVKQIVFDLKDFARPDENSLKEADLNRLIQSTVNIVRNELKYVAQLDLQLGELPPLVCIPQQINQVIANLLVNAAHAITHQGSITVRSWTEAECALFSIADTGHGIPEELLNKIFDPFFTTKEVGKGTGLGLTISYDIVHKHGGEISVNSASGVGTIFTIRLPLAGPGREVT